MTKYELVKEISYDCETDPSIVKAILDSLRLVCLRALKDGEDVKLFDGLELRVKYLPEMSYIDPRNGERVSKEYYKCKAKLSRDFKNAVQNYTE